MLGWVCNFKVDGFCRVCKTTKKDSQKDRGERSELMRTLENYKQDLAKGQNGIAYDPEWIKVVGYHCISNPSVDPMHDLNLGVTTKDLSLMLNYFIYQKHYFTLENLNTRMRYFYFDDNANEPPLITGHTLKIAKKLKMSAAETKNFIVNFCLLIGDLVPEDDEQWQLYKLLRDITSICMRRIVSEEKIKLLDKLIRQHHKLYTDLYGHTLIPKHHFLCYYPRIMRCYGPLKQLWCMRYEAAL